MENGSTYRPKTFLLSNDGSSCEPLPRPRQVREVGRGLYRLDEIFENAVVE
jgi:hypothetical protein